MFLVAVTGGIATGKSSVIQLFRENGVTVIDADLIARQIVEPGQPAYKEIKETFGDSVIKDSKEIDRDALGKLVFGNKELRIKLNEITHSRIHRTIFKQIIENFMCGAKYVVMDLPLLFETGILIDFIYKIITVTCDEETQLKRLMKRSSLSEEDAKKRIAAQMPLEQKCAKSHFVIDNSGPFEHTEKEVMKILSLLSASNHHWKIRFYMFLSVMGLIAFLFWLNYLFGFIQFNN